MKTARKTLAILICAAICISLFPASLAFADETVDMPHEHVYEAVVTEPTCTEEGYTTYTCECGDSYIDDYTDALGHTPETAEEIPPEDDAPGRTAGVVCAVCGEILDGCVEIPALSSAEDYETEEALEEDDSNLDTQNLVSSGSSDYEFLTLGTRLDGYVKDKLNNIQATEGYKPGQTYKVIQCYAFASDVFKQIFEGSVGLIYIGHTPAETHNNELIGRLFDLEGWNGEISTGEASFDAEPFDGLGDGRADSNRDNTRRRTKYGTITAQSVEELLSLALPGDIVQCLYKNGNPHTFIVNDVESSGLEVYEANYVYPGRINLGTRSWQTMANNYGRSITLYRARNYDEINIKKYTITYDANGGVGEPAAQTFEAGTPATLSSVIPTRENYTFLGWFTQPEGGDQITEDNIGAIATNLTLYAHWEANPVYVTLIDGDVAFTTLSRHYGDCYGELPERSKNRFSFLGWFTAENGGAQVSSTTIITNPTDHTLYAHWEGDPVTVTLMSDGEPYRTRSLRYGDAYGDLPTPSKSGYYFAGWYTEEVDGERVLSTTEITNAEDHSIYAHWEDASNPYGGVLSQLLLGINYEEKSDGTIKITYGNLQYFIGDIVLPSEINGKTVSEIATGALQYLPNMTSLVIPDTVTKMGTGSVAANSHLKSVHLPEGLTSIPMTCLAQNSALESVNIPEGVTSIGIEAFKNCPSLRTLELPEGLKTIGSEAFRNCSALREMVVPEGVTTIGQNAFRNCERLERVSLPASWQPRSTSGNTTGEIFLDCPKLKSAASSAASGYANISYAWTGEIPSYAFCGMTSLESIELPGSISTIGASAFEGCTALASISIPQSVTVIGSSAFSGCTSLRKVILNGDASLGTNVFYGCTGITSAGPLHSGANFEFGWTSEIPQNVFNGCTALRSVSLPWTITSIGDEAFRETGIVNISLPDGLKNIGHYAFYRCEALESISLPEGLATLGIGAFAECSALTDISIPSSVTVIPSDLFSNCTSLITAHFPDEVTGMGTGVFSNCSSLEFIAIPSGTERIAGGMFQNCGALDMVIIPESVKYIDENSFENCTALATVYYLSDLDAWCEITFGRVTGLENAEIIYCCTVENHQVSAPRLYGEYDGGPAWVVTDDNTLAFSGSGAVADVTDQSPAPWGDEAGSITAVHIGPNVSAIGAAAFSGLSNVDTVEFTGGVPEISADAFTGVNATVYYPADDETWKAVAGNQYGGILTWVVNAPAGSLLIDETAFPDPVFRQFVSDRFAAGKGYLTESEIEAVDRIVCNGMGITSLKGIEYFTNLQSLNCRENCLAELDLSRNAALTELICDYQRPTFAAAVEVTDEGAALNMGELVGEENIANVISVLHAYYDSETGIALFPTVPSTVTYEYLTGFGDTVIDVLLHSDADVYEVSFTVQTEKACDKPISILVYSAALTEEEITADAEAETHQLNTSVIAECGTFYSVEDENTGAVSYRMSCALDGLSPGTWILLVLADDYDPAALAFTVPEQTDLGQLILSEKGTAPVIPGEQLGMPTELSWGYYLDSYWDEDTESYRYYPVDLPGEAIWLSAEPDLGNTEISFYQTGSDEPVTTVTYSFDPENTPEYRWTDDFCATNPESGTYYFTVTQKGDGLLYKDGETAVSGEWVYEKPEAKLSTAENPVWDNSRCAWNAIAEEEYLNYYLVEFYYSAEEDGTYDVVGQSFAYPEPFLDLEDVNPDAGYYKFRVRALSNDITVMQCGDWSEFSPTIKVADKQQAEHISTILMSDGRTLQLAAENLTGRVTWEIAWKDRDYAAVDQSGLVTLGTVTEQTTVHIYAYNEEERIIEYTLIIVPASERTVVVPDAVEIIGEGAFSGNSRLEKAIISNGVTKIENAAFMNCENLRTVEIPDSVEFFGENLFAGVPMIQLCCKPDSAAARYAEENGIPVFMNLPENIRLDKEYVILYHGENPDLRKTAGLSVEGLDGIWLNQIEWTTESGTWNVVEKTASKDGGAEFKAVGQGTEYVLANVTVGDRTWSARCRIDVADENDTETVWDEVIDVTLLDTSATVELYRTEYTRIRIVPNLSQNDAQSADDVILQNPDLAGTGAAVTDAYFAEGTPAAELFDLRVVDDRTLEIVPTDDALRDGQEKNGVMSSYTSEIKVVLEGPDEGEPEAEQIFSAGTLKMTVKKSVPKIKAGAVKLNSYLEDKQEIAFSGGTVSEAVPANADSLTEWLEISGDGRTLTYKGEPKAKKSGKLNLMLTVEGWSIKVPVTVSVSAASTAPKMKFSPSTLTLKPGTYDSAATKVSITPAVFADSEKFKVTAGRIMEGKVSADDALNAAYTDGVLTVRPGAVPDDGKAHTYKLYLDIDGKEIGAVTVKTLPSKTAVSLSVKATGTIDTAIPNSPITLTPSWKNYHAGSGERIDTKNIRIYKTAANTTPTEITNWFNIQEKENAFGITLKDTAELEESQERFAVEKGYAYTATLTGRYGSGAALTSATVKLNIKSSAKAPAVSLALKATGSIDVIRPGSTKITLTPTVKNWYSYAPGAEDVTITAKNGKNEVSEEDLGDLFNVSLENGTFVITAKPGAKINHSWKYSATVKMTVNGTEYAKTTTLKVVQGKANLTQSVKEVQLLKRDRYSRGVVSIRTNDATLNGVSKVVFTDSNDVTSKDERFTVVDLGGDDFAIQYAGNELSDNLKSATVKLKVYLVGNETATPNATLSVKVNIV